MDFGAGLSTGMLLADDGSEASKQLNDFKEQQNYIITLQNIIVQQQNQLAQKDQQIKNLMTMLQEERERNK